MGFSVMPDRGIGIQGPTTKIERRTLRGTRHAVFPFLTMKIENPDANQFPSFLTEEDIVKAVQKSGYPLQTQVASLLKKNFMLHEEWCYLDEDTKNLRTIDILAEKNLYDLNNNSSRVRPRLTLAIECKQSELPYIFFETLSYEYAKDFPMFTGLHNYEIEIRAGDSRDKYITTLTNLLGVNHESFLLAPPVSCKTFSKLNRKGKTVQDLRPEDIEMSGSEAYTRLILPLLKSLFHQKIADQPPETAVYFDFSMVIGVGVLDAPMLTYRIEDNIPKLVGSPWVRVFRHGYIEGNKYDRQRMYAVDLVHSNFLQTYLEEHLEPFSQKFSATALSMHEIIASGKGYVKKSVNAFVGPFQVSSKVGS